MSVTVNPWTTISAEDYEGQMQCPAVSQWDCLSACFGQAIAQYAPEEILIVRCGTGNGLEHIDTRHSKRTTVIEIL